MKKISILSLHLGYGGIEKSIVTLANSLCNMYEIEIACCYRLYKDSVFELDKRIKVIYLNNDKIVPNRDELRDALDSKNLLRITKAGFVSAKVLHYRKKSMINYIRNCEANIIISTREFFNFWVSLYAKDGTLKIGWEHNHFHDNYKYADRVVASAKGLDYLVLVSANLQKYYSERLRGSKCMCLFIPNCIESIPLKASSLTKKRIISVGKLIPEKGILDLIRIYHILYKKYPDWRLDIVGDGKEKKLLEEYIKIHNLEKYVTLHGFQKKDYIDKLMSESSLYLMTSYTEAFGIALLEAMSFGIPCIAMDSAEGARELINSGDNGYLIKNRNYDIMVKKIEDLIEHKNERIRIGKNARESVKKFTSDAVSKEWIALIEESGVYE